MRRDVLDLRQFYASDLGRAARAMVGRKVLEAWGDARGLDVLALGYATPFVAPMQGKARRVVAAMPAQQGVEVWPADGRNLATLTPEDSLPFANALFDRILVVHGIEESPDPIGLLREVWRVLAPSGRVVVAVAARNGFWANSERTPFGHGRPYSRQQLAELLLICLDTHLRIQGVDQANGAVVFGTVFKHLQHLINQVLNHKPALVFVFRPGKA